MNGNHVHVRWIACYGTFTAIHEASVGWDGCELVRDMMKP
jgi:hypothetical protein